MSTAPIRRSISSRRVVPTGTTTYTNNGSRITVGPSTIVSGRQTSVRRLAPTVSTSNLTNLRSSRVVSRRVVGEPVTTTVRAVPTLRKSIVAVDRVERPLSSRLTSSRYVAPTSSRIVTTTNAPQTARVISTTKGTTSFVNTGVRVPHEGRILNGNTTHLGTERITRARALNSISGLTRATNVIRGALPSNRT
jgi:hypothetical protein